MDEFHLVLPSNSCPLTQPDNNSSQYITDWQNAIELPGSWEAALVEFSYIYKPLRLEAHSKITYTTSDWKQISDTYFRVKRLNKDPITAKTLQSHIGYADHINDYYIQYNRTLQIHLKNPVPYQVELKFANIQEAIIFGFEQQTGLYFNDKLIAPNPMDDEKMNTNQLYKLDLIIREKEVKTNNEIALPEKEFDSISSLVNFIKVNNPNVFQEFKLNNNANIEFTVVDRIIFIKFPKYLVNLFNIENDFFGTIANKNYVSIKKAVVHINKINQIFIYSSLIEPILVGGVKVPLLRSIAINKQFKDGEMFTKAIYNPMYIPVSSTNINNIEINIRDDFGRPLNYSTNSKSTITIHLRRKS